MRDNLSQLPRVDENQRRKLGISNASSIFAPWERTGKKKYGSYAGPYLVTLDEYLSPPHEISVIARYLKEDINMHWHDFLELEYVSTGDGVHYLNQQIVSPSPPVPCIYCCQRTFMRSTSTPTTIPMYSA